MFASTTLLAALKVMVIAGGASAPENHHSHKVHVDALIELLAQRGVSGDDVVVFWADGEDPAPDRAVVPEAPDPDAWLIEGTRLDTDLSIEPTLEDTRFPFPVRPATRASLQGWLSAVGPTLGPDDTLLIAVTDHGQPDPEGGDNTAISLWGEEWNTRAFLADLAPVPDSTRVALWMSQCFSGGFASLYRSRPNLCGVFAAHPDRPAYGCFPELAGRPDVGHFLRMVEALGRYPDLARAHEAVVLSDDTPDTPYLTSDMLLFDALELSATTRGGDLERMIDVRIDRDPERREWTALGRLADRYGLGSIHRYADAIHALDALERARYALGVWSEQWRLLDTHARGLVGEPLIRVLRPARRRDARLAQRARAIAGMKKLMQADPEVAERIRQVRHKVERADALALRIDQYESALIRAAWWLTRLSAGAGLESEAAAHYAELQACESRPLWAVEEEEAEAVEVLGAGGMPLWSTVPAEVEALRPGWLGLAYRDAPRNKGVIAERWLPGSPLHAAALAVDDRILAVDGWTLRRRGGFREAVRLAAPGQRIALTAKRRRTRDPVEVPVVIAPMPLPAQPPGVGQAVPPLGITPLDPENPPPRIGEGRPVVLFFFRTTCKPCRAAAPALVVWAEAFDVSVVAITDERPRKVRRWLRRQKGRFPFAVALDPEGEAARLFAVEQRPVFAVVDAAGVFRDEGEGYSDRVPLAEPIAPERPPPTEDAGAD